MGKVALAPRASWRPYGGGSTGEVYAAVTTGGRPVVVKLTPYPAEIEAEGLVAIRAAGAPVPEVLSSDGNELVVARVEGPTDWEALGRAVAAMHGTTADTFGWHRANMIGPELQRNDPHEHWPTFYAERRIQPFYDDVPTGVRRRLQAAASGPLLTLLETGSPPSLVHGDLWWGNVVGGRWLIDPAVHYADREFDLAVTDLFGAFPAPFHHAYAEAWPLPDGWEARRPALQLYHLLIHVHMFGPSWLGAVTERLDQLRW